MSRRRCQTCGACLETTSAGLICPLCVLQSVSQGDEVGDSRDPVSILPRTFGPFELLEELGRGGMGVVYRARQNDLGRVVAVKLLLAGRYSSEAALSRFHLEAAAAAGLQHPNIVAIHAYGEIEGQPYYAMDMVEGGDLARLCGGLPLPARRVAEITSQLATAVHYAHQHGVLHRDLKPSNVLIDPEGCLRITDFGLAKMLGSPDGMTLTGEMIGSPSYSAPEQAVGRVERIGVTTDVYGLGALCYHLSTGRAPFASTTPAGTLRMVLDADPIAPRLLNPGVPRDLETICLKCLEKDPARRYPTAAAVGEDLERFLHERPILARPPSLIDRVGKFIIRHWAGVAASATAMVSLAVGLAFALHGLHRAVEEQRRTDQVRREAEGLLGSMGDEMRWALEPRGGLAQLLPVTEALVRYYESIPPELRGPSTDRAHANALSQLGRLRRLSLADPDAGDATLRAAIALLEKIVSERPDDPDAAATLLKVQWEVPLLVDQRAGRASGDHYKNFVDRWEALHARFPTSVAVKQGLSSILAEYAMSSVAGLCRPEDAVRAATRSRALAQEITVTGPREWTLVNLKSTSLFALGLALQECGRDFEGVAACERALAEVTEALAADPANVALLGQAREAARQLSFRAMTVNPDRALEAERIARGHCRKLMEMNPGDREHGFIMALSHMMEWYYVLSFQRSADVKRRAFAGFHDRLAPFFADGENGTFLRKRAWDRLFLARVEAVEENRKGFDECIASARRDFEEWTGRMPEGSFERSIERVRFLLAQLTLFGGTRFGFHTWPEYNVIARECLAEIDRAESLEPGNGELRPARATMEIVQGMIAQRDGKPAEAVVLLRPAVAAMRAPKTRGVIFGATDAFRDDRFLASAQASLSEALAQAGLKKEARSAIEMAMLGSMGTSAFRSAWLVEEGMVPVVALDLRLQNPEAEPVRCLSVVERAERVLLPIRPGQTASDEGDDVVATLARLRTIASQQLEPSALETQLRSVIGKDGIDPGWVAQNVFADALAWNPDPRLSAIGSSAARAAELLRRESLDRVLGLQPENLGARFLNVQSRRMEGYVEFFWEGRTGAARRAFQEYDDLLEPFTGQAGFECLLQVRLDNSLHLAHLAAAGGNPIAARMHLDSARAWMEAMSDRSSADPLSERLSRVRFMGSAAWVAWWLHDWDELERIGSEAIEEFDRSPANDALGKSGNELHLRRAMMRGFLALAAAERSESKETLLGLQTAMSELWGMQWVAGVWDAEWVLRTVELAVLEAMVAQGQTGSARNLAEFSLRCHESWSDPFGEDWWTRRHWAAVEVILASLLNPAVPDEAPKRQDLLDRAAATLAPNAGDDNATIDLKELIERINRLRVPKESP